VNGPRTLLVTIATLSRQVDAVADADVPLADLVAPISSVLGLGDTETAVTVARAGDLTDVSAARPEQTLSDMSVVDGDVVVIHPADQPPAPADQLVPTVASVSRSSP
jgi:hypothetical protein